MACVPGDIVALGSTSLDNCLMTSDKGTTYFPSQQLVESCMANLGITSECSQCMGSFLGSLQLCLQETCRFDNPSSTHESNGIKCVECMINFDGEFLQNDERLCGIDPIILTGMTMDELRLELQSLATQNRQPTPI